MFLKLLGVIGLGGLLLLGQAQAAPREKCTPRLRAQNVKVADEFGRESQNDRLDFVDRHDSQYNSIYMDQGSDGYDAVYYDSDPSDEGFNPSF